jgi:hypothetical protein
MLQQHFMLKNPAENEKFLKSAVTFSNQRENLISRVYGGFSYRGIEWRWFQEPKKFS